MLLAIDVGNTHTHIGVFEERRLQHEWRIVSDKTSTADELRIRLCALLREEGLRERSDCDVVIASVVPALTKEWTVCTRALYGKEAFVCTVDNLNGLFKNKYPRPEEIGGDLAVDAIAAIQRYGAPIIIVDLGTATTIEAIDNEGYFLGGVIMPGIEISSRALSAHATMLPVLDVVPPKRVLGSTTQECMQSGIIYGEADRIDGLARRIMSEFGFEAPVVACGGLAPLIAPYSSTIREVVDDLTLSGLEYIHHWLKTRA